MTPIPIEENIVLQVYFNPYNKESLEYLESMSLGQFMKFRSALAIRESYDAERQCMEALNQKAKQPVIAG